MKKAILFVSGAMIVIFSAAFIAYIVVEIKFSANQNEAVEQQVKEHPLFALYFRLGEYYEFKNKKLPSVEELNSLIDRDQYPGGRFSYRIMKIAPKFYRLKIRFFPRGFDCPGVPTVLVYLHDKKIVGADYITKSSLESNAFGATLDEKYFQ